MCDLVPSVELQMWGICNCVTINILLLCACVHHNVFFHCFCLFFVGVDLMDFIFSTSIHG